MALFNASGHGRSHSQCAMRFDEMVIREIQGDRSLKVFHFLAESVGEARPAAQGKRELQTRFGAWKKLSVCWLDFKMTGVELFAQWRPEQTWKDAGGKHAQFANYRAWPRGELLTLCDATQQIYLDLPPWDAWLDRRRRRRFPLWPPPNPPPPPRPTGDSGQPAGSGRSRSVLLEHSSPNCAVMPKPAAASGFTPARLMDDVVGAV